MNIEVTRITARTDSRVHDQDAVGRVDFRRLCTLWGGIEVRVSSSSP